MKTVLVAHANELTALGIATAIDDAGHYKAQITTHNLVLFAVEEQEENLAAVVLSANGLHRVFEGIIRAAQIIEDYGIPVLIIAEPETREAVEFAISQQEVWFAQLLTADLRSKTLLVAIEKAIARFEANKSELN